MKHPEFLNLKLMAMLQVQIFKMGKIYLTDKGNKKTNFRACKNYNNAGNYKNDRKGSPNCEEVR